ncbi:MAG: flagellar motor switch protein FliG [Rhodobiaceae bacterium]|nr:flagellar motor switch protein FliG [Rhodobiaceae bacterium]
MSEIAQTEMNADDIYSQLTGTQKSAILMMLLGEEEASEILKNLGPKEVQHLGSAMYSVQGLDQDTVNRVLDEFLDIIKEQTSLGLGAGNYIRNVLMKALGEDKAQSVLSRITPSSSDRPIEILDWMDARAISELIVDEHPQIIALIISYLDFSMGADVLNLLPDELQPEIIRRIATLETVQPDALRELEDVMQRKFKANTTLRATQVGGVKAAAKIMNFTNQNMEARIMKNIGKDDKTLMQSIQESMFVFETLIMSDDKSLQTLLRNVEAELIVLALKGADEALREKLFSCMSSRAAANIMDEMEALGPVRLAEVQDAQKQVIAVARRLSDEGTIVLAGRGGDDFV